MIYTYYCPQCSQEFDVTKSIKEANREEFCQLCDVLAKRRYNSVVFYGEKVQNAEYNPAFGKVVKNKAHKKELCKEFGVEEIGNEEPSKIHQHFDKMRAEKLKREWEKV